MSTSGVLSEHYRVRTFHASLVDAIAAGKYDYANEHITAKNFELSGEIVVHTDLVLYHPDCTITSDDVVRQLDQLGLRPANLQELLAFGETYPDVQREFPIMALDTSWVHAYGYRFVPCLVRKGAGREILLEWFGDEWPRGCRFLAVRK